MDKLNELVLIVGIICLSLFCMKLSHDVIQSTQMMSQQLQMMFVKS